MPGRRPSSRVPRAAGSDCLQAFLPSGPPPAPTGSGPDTVWSRISADTHLSGSLTLLDVRGGHLAPAEGGCDALCWAVVADLLTADNLIALATLTLLEVVLGIDNVVFIAIVAGNLPPS